MNMELERYNPENFVEPQITFNGEGAEEMFNHWAKLKDGILHFPFSDLITELDCRSGSLIVFKQDGILRMTLEVPNKKPIYLEFEDGAVQVNHDQFYGDNE